MKRYLYIFLKGMGMGAADVVPGVSGGTIAFITGIYEELINSIKSVNVVTLKLLLKGDLAGWWKAINGTFLVSLFAGILLSVLSLVKVLSWLLANYEVLVWSFFFGLIVASAIIVARKVRQWSTPTVVALLIGAAIALYISLATPAQTPDDLWFIFLSGAIAICAMILPGISGSFILLLLRKYAYILEAAKDLDIKVLLVFIAGCIAGLLSFARLLSWMFKRYHDLTIALLTGFMLGSLNMVWPWKKVVEYRLDSHGAEVPFRYASVWPRDYPGESWLFGAIVLAIIAFVFIYLIEKAANKGEEV